MDYTKFEVTVWCARCGEKAVLSALMLQNQESVSVDWVCPNCGAKRTIGIKRAEAKPAVEQNEKSVKFYNMVDGERREVDDEGNLKKTTSERFNISYPKKKKETKVPIGSVGKIE